MRETIRNGHMWTLTVGCIAEETGGCRTSHYTTQTGVGVWRHSIGLCAVGSCDGSIQQAWWNATIWRFHRPWTKGKSTWTLSSFRAPLARRRPHRTLCANFVLRHQRGLTSATRANVKWRPLNNPWGLIANAKCKRVCCVIRKRFQRGDGRWGWGGVKGMGGRGILNWWT
jgi:hypothetical protein